MPLCRPIPPVTLDTRMREELQTLSRSRSLPQALTQRAKTILLAADGFNNSSIAVQLQTYTNPEHRVDSSPTLL